MTDTRTAATRLAAVPLVPEVVLDQATDAIALWQKLERASGHEEPPPFWAFAWAGGQALARCVLDSPELVAGRRVFDLASGSGLVAIAAALAGAGSVTACEIDARAIAAIEANAMSNGVSVQSSLTDVLDGDVIADVVLAGDVFYERVMASRVLAFLHRCARSGASVYVGDPGRAYLPREEFERVVAYDVPVVADLEDGEFKHTTVWRLR